MRKFLLFLPLFFLLFTSCTNQSEVEEPFSADFTYKDRSFEPTSIVFDNGYTGETYVYTSDSVNYSDIAAFCKNTLFSSQDSAPSLLSGEIKLALSGNFTPDDAESLNEIVDTLNKINAFPGIREVTSSDADFVINFSDKEGFDRLSDPYGSVIGAKIFIPSDLSIAQRKQLMCKYLFCCCGFNGFVDTPLESVISANPSDFFSDTDLLILEALYSVGNSDMSQDEFLVALENYFFNKY